MAATQMSEGGTPGSGSIPKTGTGPGGVAVIVVNYATATLTAAAVDSVLFHRHGGLPVAVHVLDNASPGDDWEMLKAAHAARGWGGRVTLHRSERNLGFGCGNNLVLRALAVGARAAPPPEGAGTGAGTEAGMGGGIFPAASSAPSSSARAPASPVPGAAGAASIGAASAGAPRDAPSPGAPATDAWGQVGRSAAAPPQGGAAAGAPLPDKLFLLNPDARLDNEAIAVLADFLDAHPRVAAVGARILQPGPPGQPPAPVTAAFRFPSLLNEFTDSVALGPVARRFAHRSVSLPAALPTGPVDWVSGAAVMFRREALEAAGGFDPVFFLYYEEVELMHRLRRAGWDIWHVAEARILHEGGAATRIVAGLDAAGGRLPDYWYDSWGSYFRRTGGRGRALGCAVARMAGWALHHAASRLRRRPPLVPRGFLDGFGRRVLRPLLGLAPAPPRTGRGR